MKRILSLCTMFLLVFNIAPLAAGQPSIEFSGGGKLKKGETATISVNVKDANRLYAVSMEYKYNPEDIKVISSSKGEVLVNADFSFMDSSGQAVEAGKPAKYYFTFTGEKPGTNENGQIIKVEVEALKDCEVTFNKSNMDIILVGIDESFEVAKMSYNFIGTESSEVVNPDGGSTEKPGEDVTNEDGTITHPDGSITNTDGTIKHPDGSVTNTDGSITKTDGTVVKTDGTVVKPDGTVVKPDGSTSTSDDKGEAADAKSKGNTTLYVILAILVVGGGITGVYYWKKKKIGTDSEDNGLDL